MERSDVKDAVLEAIETSLDAQLRAIKKLRSPAREPERKERPSQIDAVHDVLKRAGAPLHVSEIISRVKIMHGLELNRESIVSALSKKVAAKDRFVRTGKNTFALR